MSPSTRQSKAPSAPSVGPIRQSRRGVAWSPINPTSAKSATVRTKSGCFTCRVRRKRCDLKKGANDSCETCTRLRIECLGWGAKRPDWIRDKKLVEQFKRNMRQIDDSRFASLANEDSPTAPRTVLPEKHHLQPRESLDSHQQNLYQPGAHELLSPLLPESANSESTSPFPWGGFPTSPFDAHLQMATGNVLESLGFTTPFSLEQQSHPTVGSIVEGSMIGLPQLPDSLTSLASPANAPSFTLSEMGHFQDSSTYTIEPQSLNHSRTSLTSSLPQPWEAHVNSTFYETPMVPILNGGDEWRNCLQQIHYYFTRVRSMQYCFAGKGSTDIMVQMVTGEPHGVVTNSICALAAIHDTLMRQSAGVEAREDLPLKFFTYADAQIRASKLRNGTFTATDATAALQFVSFSLFVGGVNGWQPALQIAGDWYESLGVVESENPLQTMWSLNDTAKFASRILVWFDIFSSVTSGRPPRFIGVYRKILGGKLPFWRRGLNMETTMGCPDDVLLAIAEISTLAAWKHEQIQKGTLDYAELNQRAIDIQVMLQKGAAVHSSEEAAQRKLEEGRQYVTKTLFQPIQPYNSDMALATFPSNASIGSSSAASQSGSSGVRSRSNTPPHSHSANHTALPQRPEGLDDLDIQCLASKIFRDTAYLYLQSVVTEATSPALSAYLRTLFDSAVSLPPSDVDKSLVFPFTLAGCLSDTPAERDFFKGRLSPHRTVGNCVQAVRLIDAVWAKKSHAATQGVQNAWVDWRMVMREMGANILLV